MGRKCRSIARRKPYHTTWAWLFLAWMFLYIDRSITGPVVAWMIGSDLPMVSGSSMPHTLGGLIGGMFFAGYMLTQYPAGYLGDRYGRRSMVFLSTLLAAVATLLTGMARSLHAFVAARVLTGLVEGAYYSNDRALIASTTPAEKKGMAMGVIFSGLAVGLTIATLLTPHILGWASGWMGQEAWTLPFLLFSVPTFLVALGLWRHVRPAEGERQRVGPAAVRLLAYSAVLLAILMAVYTVAQDSGLAELVQVGAVALTALALVAVIYSRMGRRTAVLRDRDLLIMYLSAVPILYALWFFGFWALLVVSESASIGLDGAALYAAFFGLANGLGLSPGRLHHRPGGGAGMEQEAFVRRPVSRGRPPGMRPRNLPWHGRERLCRHRPADLRHRAAVLGHADGAYGPDVRPCTSRADGAGLRDVEPGGRVRRPAVAGRGRLPPRPDRFMDLVRDGDRRPAGGQRGPGAPGAPMTAAMQWHFYSDQLCQKLYILPDDIFAVR